MKIFYDSEFTGLHKETTLISVGLVSEDGRTFYAEFNDYDSEQVDDWIEENVLDNLLFEEPDPDGREHYERTRYDNNVPLTEKWNIMMRGSSLEIADALSEWLSQFDDVQIVSDCLAYDWVLFCDIFGHAFDVPKNVYYIPFDICSMFYVMGIDPDISREEFAGNIDTGALTLNKHNALWDALVIKSCFAKIEKLMKGGK